MPCDVAGCVSNYAEALGLPAAFVYAGLEQSGTDMATTTCGFFQECSTGSGHFIEDAVTGVKFHAGACKPKGKPPALHLLLPLCT